MNVKSIILSTVAAVVLVPTIALAKDSHASNGIRYSGPVDVVTVSSLLEDTGYFTEKDVVVDGYLLRQTRKDEFIFSDGETEIQVELDDDINMTESVDATTKVRLFGEYEGGKTPEIEVDHIQIL
tara:strand:- start:2662 stop:3036 length:375 start_codon:yes stop_codon:yes gene_type:complete